MLSTFKKTPGDSFHTGDIVNLKDLSECKILKQDGRHVRVEVVESKKITWVPVTDILPDSGDDRLLPADPLEGHELGGIPLDMLSRLDLSGDGTTTACDCVFLDDPSELTTAQQPQEEDVGMPSQSSVEAFNDSESGVGLGAGTSSPAPSSLCLVVREELLSVACSNGESRLSARVVDNFDVLHTFVVGCKDAPPPHGDYNLPVCLIVKVDDGDPESSTTPAVPAAPAQGMFLQITMNASAGEIEAVLVDPPLTRKLKVGQKPGKDQLFSRNKGILETDLLCNKTVAIIGLGSGGGVCAVELAKSGVGNFILVDNERLEIPNVSRHVLDARDVGRLKTNAMSDAVKARNPHARVVKAPMDVVAQRGELKALLLREGADLLIMATDTKSSRGVLNDLALDLGIVAIFGRTIVRASGGDVLRVRPNNNNNGPSLPPSRSSGLKTLAEDLDSCDYWVWGNRREDIYKDMTPLGADITVIPVESAKDGAWFLKSEPAKAAFCDICQGVKEDTGLEMIDARTEAKFGRLIVALRLRGSQNTFVLHLTRGSDASSPSPSSPPLFSATLVHSHDPRCSVPIDTAASNPSDHVNVPSIIAQVKRAIDPLNKDSIGACCKQPFAQSILRWYGTTTKVGCIACKGKGGGSDRQYPCLGCVFDQEGVDLGADEVTSVEAARAVLPDYAGVEDIGVAVQPGLASDIAPISQFMVKLSLLELSRQEPGDGGKVDNDDGGTAALAKSA